ncbi:MAG: alpha-glucosidase [Spirochaetia bacterium]|nr:alpha-glucosidase [Spirochaetia bacterium]
MSKKKSLSQPWWKETTVYQVYPRSFKDSRGDGIGDLEGIISRLDYLQELGIETIWLSPFYTSPQQDLGYDISNYCDVSPEYGSLEVFDRLLFEVHQRKMKLVLDMVLNHTSIQHPWFRESASGRENPKRNWYVWRDGRKPEGKAPPNNWRSMVGGSGWHYHRETRQWYWASFLSFQPDLNYRNPEVKQEMFKVLRFWLDRGVDGFRLDIIGAVYEDPFFRDNPFTWKLLPDEENTGFLFRSHRMTQNHPDNFKFARELRVVVDEYSSPNNPSQERVLIGETFGSPDVLRRYCGQEQPDALHLVFLFKTMATPFSATAFRNLVEEFEKVFPAPFIPTYVYSNHDRFRRISVLGEDIRKAKLNSLFQFTVRGVPFIYYGEEIGMRQGRIKPKDTRDAVARHIGTVPAAKLKLLNRLTNGAIQRDGCRTPMQWDSSVQAGFTKPTVEPWLPVNDNSKKVNAAEQKGRGDALYTCYQQLLELRRRYPALHRGSLKLLSKSLLPKTVLGYIRSTPEGEPLLVLLNFSNKIQRFSLPLSAILSTLSPTSGSNSEAEVQLLFSTTGSHEPKSPSPSRFSGELQPYEGLLLIILCPDQGPSASDPA